MLSGRELIKIANKIKRQSVVSWTMVGDSYVRGRKVQGYTRLELSGGGCFYPTPIDLAIGPALDDAESVGFDVKDARRKLDQWVETGIGVSFAFKGGE